MPVVSLTSTVVFSPITGTSSTTHNGLMVWNNSTSTANGLTGDGFYFWENHPTTAGAGNWYRLTTTGDEVIPTGTVTHTTLRWNGTTWVENQGLQSDGSTTTSLTTELLVGNNATVTGTLEVSDNATITGALVVENNATVTGTLAVTGNTTVTGDVVVEGSTSLATTTLGAVLQDYEGDKGTAGQVLSSTGTSTNWVDNFAPDAGTVTNTSLRWNGTAWVENQGFQSDGSATTSLTTELQVGNNATVTGTLEVSDNATITGALVVENNATVTGTLAVTGNTTVTGDLVVAANTTASGTLTANSTTTLNAALVDAEGNPGTAGQVLSSTGTQTNWISISTDSITDTDTDTKIQVEEGSDDDTIRIDAAGVEVSAIDSSTFAVQGANFTVKGPTSVATQTANTNPGTAFTTILDISTADSSTIDLSAVSVVAGGFSTTGTYNSATPKVDGEGFTVSNATVVVGNLETAYWYYVQDGGFRRFIEIEFQLSGNNLQVRELNPKVFNSSTPLTVAQQTDAYFTSNGAASAINITDVAVVYQPPAGATYLIVNATSGNVGIGTNSPTHTLTVEGTAKITGAVQLSNYGAGAVQSDANGNLSVSSDERLKTVLSSFERGLKEILQLKPINYQWNALSGLDQEHTYSGFSAQNVQAVIPEAVGQDQKGYLTLSDRPIIGALVNAIKALKTENDQLKKQVKSFLLRLEKLEKESLDNIP